MRLALPGGVSARAAGPLLTLLVIAGIELLVRTGVLSIPNPVSLALIAVVYSGYAGGRASGLLSALLALLYGLYFYSPPGAPLQFKGEDATRLAVLTLAASFIAWMTGALKDRAEEALRRQIESEKLHVAQLEGAARRLRASELQLRTLVDSIPASVTYVDRDQRVRFHNRWTEEMMNLPGQLIDGRTVEELLGKEAYEAAKSHVLGALEGRAATYERSQTAGGGRRIVEVNLVPARADDEGVAGYFALIFDVTRHKQAQADLARLGERLRRALAASSLVLWEMDVRAATVELGREWADIVGGEGTMTRVPAAELRGLVHPADRPRVDAAVAAVLARRAEQYDVEHRVRARDGGWRWIRSVGRAVEFDAQGAVTRLSGTNRDVTRRKLADLALAENESRLRLIANAVPAMVVYVDRELRYEFCNRHYQETMGRAEGEILGRTVREVVGEAQFEFSRPWLERALAGEQVAYERRHRMRDGSVMDLAVTYVPHVDDAGGVKGLYTMLLDLTERRRAERIREKFISMVSHELRTPLTSIIWTLDGLAERGPGGERTEEDVRALRIAQENAERMLHLADEILEVELIDQAELRLRPRMVSLAELIGRVVELNEGYAGRAGVALGVAQLPELEVNADPDRIVQVLTNLVSNAVKHSHRGGSVEIALQRQGALARVSVADRGAGVPESFRAELFGRFAQSADGRKRGGAGLGLAIAREIVESSGGRIGYEPNAGGGSVFWFELPVPGAARERAGPQPG